MRFLIIEYKDNYITLAIFEYNKTSKIVLV